MHTVLVNGQIVTPDGIVAAGGVAVADGVITRAGSQLASTARSGELIDLDNDFLLPGFVDVQVNGGGGVLFNDDPGAQTALRMVQAHRRFGTTSLLPTLISDELDKVEQAIRAIDTEVANHTPGIAGVHIEGPFLNVAKRGIHDQRKLQKLSSAAIALLTSARHAQVVVTLAPECAEPGQIARLVAGGVKVCLGHTNATFEQTRAALAAGATGFTHLFNANSAMQSRSPGVIPAALESSACCGLIVDGKHVHPAMLRLALRAKADRRLMLVTDAMPVVGTEQDSFQLGGQHIRVEDGTCRAADGTLAGSALSMLDAVRNAQAMLGVSMAQASAMASRIPAWFLGIDNHTGSITAGKRADLIRLSPTFAIRQVWVGGVEQPLQANSKAGQHTAPTERT